MDEGRPRPAADPANYQRLRQIALRPRPPRAGEADPKMIRTLLMDQHAGAHTSSVMAGAEGSASLYLSSGGCFLGGGQRHPEIRQAALDAVETAGGLRGEFRESLTIGLPPQGQVFFYMTLAAGLLLAVADEAALKHGSSPLRELWTAMHRIMTLYRTLPMGLPADSDAARRLKERYPVVKLNRQ